MPIEIKENQTTKYVSKKPFKEIMNLVVPNINHIFNKNGQITIISGASGSGKSNMVLSMFNEDGEYRKKFNHIYFFCPEVSLSSIENHPFREHDEVYHELTEEHLENVIEELETIKQEYYDEMKTYMNEPKKTKNKKPEMQYSLLIIDDFASDLKTKSVMRALNKMCIKTRHLCCGIIIITQSYSLVPKTIRKQMTNLTMFKPRNFQEFELLRQENLPYTKDDAMKIYKYVFTEPYQHLDFDKTNDTLYKNFNKLEITEI
jgi:ABC-type ATPase with predicted acetyltransferase domain